MKLDMTLEKHFRLFLILVLISGFLLGFILGEATISPTVEKETSAYELVQEIHRINAENK